jgi:hypothetical protein
MCRSINAQAEFWMKIGKLAEANPTLAFNEIIQSELKAAMDHQAASVEAA